MAIKTLNVNVRGLGNHIKRMTLFQFFKTEKCDIICLQETEILESVDGNWVVCIVNSVPVGFMLKTPWGHFLNVK